MLIPFSTNNRLSHTPTANYVLIIVNVIIYLIPFIAAGVGSLFSNPPEDYAGDPKIYFYNIAQGIIKSFMLHSERPQLHEFISYAFLHASFAHILGNMFFLWLFGNNVNDRLGHTGYVILYLGGAVFSGLGHAYFELSPVLGASGAVAAVTGAYMVLFPKTYVNVLIWFLIITTIEVQALWFILFKLIILDNVIPRQFPQQFTDNIAYGAHLAGYAYGIAVPMLMLSLKLLPHSHFDLWALTQRWHRRQQFSHSVNRGDDPFRGISKDKKTVYAKVKGSHKPDPHAEQISQLRGEVSTAVYAGDFESAATIYQRILRLDPNQLLPQQQQLDISNKLMEIGQHGDAARGYELFLEKFANYPFIEQIRLMLGLLYSRYLAEPTKAKENLLLAMKGLTDAGQRQMCSEELAKLDGEA
jgi:membrane associated rhomboid family serine protease